MLTPGDGVSMPSRSRLDLGSGWSFVVAVKPEGDRGKGTDLFFYSECRVDFSRSRKAEIGHKLPLTKGSHQPFADMPLLSITLS
jgi:hypothetical protein